MFGSKKFKAIANFSFRQNRFINRFAIRCAPHARTKSEVRVAACLPRGASSVNTIYFTE